ncbi:MAG: hypothetical protein EOO11_16050 [Chitinophagaceae bacterium]|nr:MAG: hypothetical protein EOO11_16050 [Chitinophagaceae bacterium]
MRWLQTLTCMFLILLVGCGHANTTDDAAPGLLDDTSAYPRVYVYRDGLILMNGSRASLSQLEQKIADVARKDRLILFASEDPSEDPPREGPVAELFKKYRVGIRTYTDSTFTHCYY